jgi:hypothetical protein
MEKQLEFALAVLAGFIVNAVLNGISPEWASSGGIIAAVFVSRVIYGRIPPYVKPSKEHQIE